MNSWKTDPDNPEYRYMWEQVATHPLNKDLRDPHVALNQRSHEAWQYMGTWSKAGSVSHEFRHRDHPLLDARIVIRIPASPAYDGEPIIWEQVFGDKVNDPF